MSGPKPTGQQPTYYQPVSTSQGRGQDVGWDPLQLSPLRLYSEDMSATKPSSWARFTEGSKSVGIKALWGLGVVACGALALATAPIQVVGIGILAGALYGSSNSSSASMRTRIIGIGGAVMAAPTLGAAACFIELTGITPDDVKKWLESLQQPSQQRYQKF